MTLQKLNQVQLFCRMCFFNQSPLCGYSGLTETNEGVEFFHAVLMCDGLTVCHQDNLEDVIIIQRSSLVNGYVGLCDMMIYVV